MIAQARQRAGISQTELAQRLHLSRGMVGMMESGDRKPTPEIIAATAKVTGDLALIAEAAWHSPLGVFCGPVLDKADTHPVAVTQKLREELEEALQAVDRLRLVNKRRPEDLGPDEATVLDKASDEVYDIITACINWFIAIRPIGVDIYKVRSRHCMKLRTRGYISAKPAN